MSQLATTIASEIRCPRINRGTIPIYRWRELGDTHYGFITRGVQIGEIIVESLYRPTEIIPIRYGRGHGATKAEFDELISLNQRLLGN